MHSPPPICGQHPDISALQDKQTVDPNRVGGPTNSLLGENALTTTIGAAGGLANDAASNALRRMAARSAALGSAPARRAPMCGGRSLQLLLHTSWLCRTCRVLQAQHAGSVHLVQVSVCTQAEADPAGTEPLLCAGAAVGAAPARRG